MFVSDQLALLHNCKTLQVYKGLCYDTPATCEGIFSFVKEILKRHEKNSFGKRDQVKARHSKIKLFPE